MKTADPDNDWKIERMPIPPEELRVLADMTVELTKLRQNECKHLAIENFAPELWRNLLMVTYPPPRMILTDGPSMAEQLGVPAR